MEILFGFFEGVDERYNSCNGRNRRDGDCTRRMGRTRCGRAVTHGRAAADRSNGGAPVVPLWSTFNRISHIWQVFTFFGVKTCSHLYGARVRDECARTDRSHDRSHRGCARRTRSPVVALHLPFDDLVEDAVERRVRLADRPLGRA